MIFRSLEITGFKSFAQPVRLEFPRGITALVGPNGSGKSNVVDAVRWCLGEQSMRDLRSQRAEDVIHASPRKVLGAAEVALTFESGADDVGVGWSELCLSRRLYRSGESEYLVNRQKGRLRDMLSALHTVGIDAGRYVIVNQGMADLWLSATPAERRALLEQAAGLASYRDQRDEARQKLTTTSHNIEMIEAVLVELEPRLRLLRRQARAVEERDQAQARLRSRLTEWYGARWHRMINVASQLAQEVDALAADRKRRADEVQRLEDMSEQRVEEERSWHRQIEMVSTALHEREREREEARYDLQYVEDRRARVAQALEVAQAQEAQLKRSLEELLQRSAESDEKARHADSQRAETVRAVEEAQRAIGDRKASVVEAEGGAAAARASFAAVDRERAVLDVQLAASRAHLRRLQVEAGSISSSLATIAGKIGVLDAHGASLHMDLESARAQHAERSRAQAMLAMVANRSHQEADRLERICSKSAARLSASVSLLTTSEAAVVSMIGDVGRGILGTLLAEPGWEVAVSAALGEWSHAEMGNGGEAPALRGADPREFYEWRRTLDHLLGPNQRWADTVVTGVPESHIHPLLATILVDSEDQGERLWNDISDMAAHLVSSPAVHVVSQSGRIWSPIGTRRGRDSAVAAHYLRLKGDVQRLQKRVHVLERRQSALNGARDACKERKLQADEAARSGRQELASAEVSVDRLLAEVETSDAERQRLGNEAESLEQRGCELRSERERVERELDALERAAQLAQETIETLRVELEGNEKLLERERSQLVAASEELAERRVRLQSLVERDQIHRASADASRREMERLHGELGAGTTAREQLSTEIASLQARIEAARERLARQDMEAVQQHARLAALRANAPSTEDQTGSLRASRAALSQHIAGHEQAMARQAQVREEIRKVAEEVWRELEIDASTLRQPAEDQPSDDEIRRLRARAAQYPDADASVVEEAAQLGERQRHLTEQVEDLKVASEHLGAVMAAADREMRSRFRSAFEAVNEEFSRVFRTMLRGGEAHLELNDDDGGVEIRAQLPGRRARSSAAFSGGERALVASSMLFGVLRIRPTPFCILDEVDAALDESNVDRYLAVLREMSRKTQIIVVTHNRATMAAADVLYGLNMNPEGVSSVLSLRLTEFEPERVLSG